MTDMARAKSVVIEKHGRPVVVVMAVEEYERLSGITTGNGQRDKQGPKDDGR